MSRSLVFPLVVALGCGTEPGAVETGDESAGTDGGETESAGDSTTGEPDVCEPASSISAQDVTDPDLGLLLAPGEAPFDLHVTVVDPERVRVSWVVSALGVAELRHVEVAAGVVGSVASEALASSSATQPAFASDAGTTHVGWVDEAGTLQLSSVDASGATQHHGATSTAAAGVQQPTLAVSQGSVAAAWYQGQYELQLATDSDASGVPDTISAVPVTVNRTFGVLSPHLGSSADGVLRLAWEDIDPGSPYPDSPDIFMIERQAGDAGGPASWSPAANLSMSLLHHSSEPHAVAGPDGWHVVWVEQNHGADITNFEVWYSFESGGGFTTPFDISREGLTSNILSPQWPRIGVDCSEVPRFAWFSRPPDRPADSAILHYALDATTPFVPVLAAWMNHDAAWRIDSAGVHHFAWVTPPDATGNNDVRYLRLP